LINGNQMVLTGMFTGSNADLSSLNVLNAVTTSDLNVSDLISGNKMVLTGMFTGTNIAANNILPTMDGVYNLGTTGAAWRHLYLSSGSLYIGDVKLSMNGYGALAVGAPINASSISVPFGTISSFNSSSISTSSINASSINTYSLTVGSTEIALGSNAGSISQGLSAVAIGDYAGRTNQNTNSVAIGPRAGEDTQGTGSVGIGYYAGRTQQGANCVAIGNSAGQQNQQDCSVAIGGGNAGGTSQGTGSIALGFQAGQYTQGPSSVSVGCFAGLYNQGADCIAIGNGAGQATQQACSIAIGGGNAGNYLQGTGSIAMGFQAGAAAPQGQYSIVIGSEAFNSNTSHSISMGRKAYGYSNNSIALNAQTNTPLYAYNAGFYVAPVRFDNGPTGVLVHNTSTNEISTSNQIMLSSVTTSSLTVGSSTIALGTGAGIVSQGSSAVAIGYDAGKSFQSANSVAIGTQAGEDTQGPSSVGIGQYAGKTNQGANCVAIGNSAAQVNQQDYSVAIGASAGGSSNSQGTGSIALGYSAGAAVAQGEYSIVIGSDAFNMTTSHSISIGRKAYGYANSSIALNAQNDTPLYANNAGFYVAPVRFENSPTGVLVYNTSTNEISASNKVVLDSVQSSQLLTTLSGVSVTSGVGYVSNAVMTGGMMGGRVTFDYDSNGYTPAANDTLVTITFGTAFNIEPFVTVTPASNKAAKLLTSSTVYVNSTTTTFSIKVGDDLPADLVYSSVSFNYTVVGA